MRIGLIAPAALDVPPAGYGGIELVLDLLARGLVDAGHEVVLAATATSTCPVDRLPLDTHAVGVGAEPTFEAAHVALAMRSMVGHVDVVHDHTTFGLAAVASGTVRVGPFVHTVHGNFVQPTATLVQLATARAAVVAISHHQASTSPVPVAAVIHHATDLSRDAGSGRGGYALFLGRMSPTKGVHDAIDLCRRAGRPLLIAARLEEAHERAYFEEMVEPRLGGEIRFLGEADAEQKATLLDSAACLVNPIAWDEPFGMVMVEALAAGTPVVATKRGSAPELIRHGVTGYVSDDQDELVDAIRRADRLNRRTCRSDAELRFSPARMAADHIALYERVLDERAERAG
jgi:glycosyltransferase involved in cell wall biosynthesis